MPPTGFLKDLFVHKQLLGDSFDCAVCLNVLRDPVFCPNSHTFCRACLTRSLERSRNCPTCREGVRTLQPNLPVRNFLDGADVFCSTRLDGVEGNQGCNLDSTPEGSRKRSRSPDQAGPATPAKLSKHNEDIETAAAASAADQDHCPWIGKLKDAEAHLLLCPFALVPCNHAGCEVKVMRRLLDQHQLGCPYRPAPCQHCHTNLPFRQLASHFISCTKRPVPCPNGCLQDEEQGGGSVTNVPFDKLTQHRSVCPLELVPCKHAGCEVKIMRRLLEQHHLGCPYRPSSCQHCHKNLPFHQLASHLTSCSKRPVPCPNGCLQDEEQGGGSVTNVPFDRMLQHRRVCPRQLIACKFAHTGCTVMQARRTMAAHEQDAGLHIDGVLKALKAAQQQQEAARLRSEATEQKLAVANTSIKTLTHDLKSTRLRSEATEEKLTTANKANQDLATDLLGARTELWSAKTALQSAQEEIQGLTQDVNFTKAELQAAEAALQPSQQKIRSLLLLAPQLLWKANFEKASGDEGCRSHGIRAQGFKFSFQLQRSTTSDSHHACYLDVSGDEFPVTVSYTLELVAQHYPFRSVKQAVAHTFSSAGSQGQDLVETSELHSRSYVKRGVITIKAIITSISYP